MNILTSNQNKETLWNILYNNKTFDQIPNNKIDSVREIFEKNITKIAFSDSASRETILNLNKTIIKNIVSELNTFKQSLLTGTNVKSDFKDEKNLVFDKKFEEKKVLFNNIMKTEKPSEINFSENIDDPIENDEMTRKLAEFQKERNVMIPNENPNVIKPKLDIIIEELPGDINSSNGSNGSNGSNSSTNRLNIIEEVNIIPSNQVNEKMKIMNLEDLITREEEMQNQEIQQNTFSTNKLPNINTILQHEYASENLMIINSKIDKIYKQLEKIQENQDKIMDRLFKNDEIQ